jgi:hypothetical protein
MNDSNAENLESPQAGSYYNQSLGMHIWHPCMVLCELSALHLQTSLLMSFPLEVLQMAPTHTLHCNVYGCCSTTIVLFPRRATVDPDVIRDGTSYYGYDDADGWYSGCTRQAN